VANRFNWNATFLVSSVSPLLVRGEPMHGPQAELASKLAWAIGTTLEIPYKKATTVREDCSFLAAFIVDNLHE